MTGWIEAHRALWRWARIGVGAAILAVLVARVGAGPFLTGVRRVDFASIVAAVTITGATTAVSAWRWCRIGQGLGLDLRWEPAVAAYYRSQFLNSTLPGGVVGDVHRGLRQGAQAGDRSAGLRSVAWDRAVGQVVQVGLAALTLLVIASPVRPALVSVGVLALAGLAVVAIVVRAASGRGSSWPARVLRAARADLRATVLNRRSGPAILLASALVVAGHVGVFLVAARAAGTTASTAVLLPIALLVLLSMTVPTSIGGWGPREGVAAWAFAAAGLGAARGVETATAYGVLSLVATLPGAVVLFVTPRPQPTETREVALTHG